MYESHTTRVRLGVRTGLEGTASVYGAIEDIPIQEQSKKTVKKTQTRLRSPFCSALVANVHSDTSVGVCNE